jgi:hypothetical protein
LNLRLDLKLSYLIDKFTPITPRPGAPPTMLPKLTFIRVLAIPACVVWGVMEFIALQRSRLYARRKLV